MKNLAKKLANRVRTKHKSNDKNEEYLRIKRKVLVRVPRRVESLQPEEVIEDKGKFFKSVKQVLRSIRVKDALMSVKNNYFVERLTSRFKGTQAAEIQDGQGNSEMVNEILMQDEDFTSQKISLYMPLQF
jgi:hypothetical protein